jgi:hypothetical protein
MAVRCKLPGGAGIDHYGPNQSFVESSFYVGAESHTFEKVANSNKCRNAVVKIASICTPILHIILCLNTPKYVALFAEGMFHPFNAR